MPMGDDIQELENELQKLNIGLMKMELPTRDCCIYRVPKALRDIKPEAYTPRLISIGPLHHRTTIKTRSGEETVGPPPVQVEEESVSAGEMMMETVKLEYLKSLFYKRIRRNLQELRDIVEQRKERIRRCYEETKPKDDVEFVNIILKDSLFIIELFLKTYEAEKDQNDFILGKPWRRTAVMDDLMLLENQLPYFIIDDLYRHAIANVPAPWPSFLDLTHAYFKPYFGGPTNANYETLSCDCCKWLYCFCLNKSWRKCQNSENQQNRGEAQMPFIPLHFTDLIRWHLSPKHDPHPHSKKIGEENRKPSPQHCIRIVSCCCHAGESEKGAKYLFSATKLHEAGVTFKVCKTEWPLGITFEDGVLSMRVLKIDDCTERQFRNLMAFEQCHYPDKAYICNYIKFIDRLIDTEGDVELLIDRGIIVHWLGDTKSVATLFNNLNDEIVEDDFLYETIWKRLNDHYGNSWYRTAAILRRVYFSNLWKGSGTVVAMLLLVLTFIQSINSLMQIFKLR